MTITIKVPDRFAEIVIDAVDDLDRALQPYGAEVDAHFDGAWDWDEVPR